MHKQIWQDQLVFIVSEDGTIHPNLTQRATLNANYAARTQISEAEVKEVFHEVGLSTYHT